MDLENSKILMTIKGTDCNLASQLTASMKFHYLILIAQVWYITFELGLNTCEFTQCFTSVIDLCFLGVLDLYCFVHFVKLPETRDDAFVVHPARLGIEKC